MHIVIVGLICAALAVVGWFVVPKGKNQMYVTTSKGPVLLCNADLSSSVIRTSIALTLTCTYLMWAITYLAQLHPLIGKLFFARNSGIIADDQHQGEGTCVLRTRSR